MQRWLPRLPAPLRRAVALASLLVAMCTAAAVLGACATAQHAIATDKLTAPAVTLRPTVSRVVILLSPFLSWDDLSPERTPELWSLASDGAVANMNAITGDPGWPTVAGGALSLSASRWAAAAAGASAEASQLPAARSANAASLALPDLGALGSVIRSAGGRTAAVGNADEGTSTPESIRRPATLVATDRTGAVDRSLTGTGLLAPDPVAPFGVRANRTRLRAATAIALLDKPSLLVVDPGDLERAHNAPLQPSDEYQAHHAQAVVSLDKTLGDLRRSAVDSSTLLMVVTPATDKPYYEPPYFAPVIVVGSGLGGTLSSASTHRPGLITNLDIAPTVLQALGLEATATMVGRPVSASDGAAAASTGPAATIAALTRLGRWVGAVDYVRDLLFLKPFVYGALLVALLAMVLAFAPTMLRPVGRFAILLALSVPPAAWLMVALERYPQTPAAVLRSFGVATVIVFVAALALALIRRLPPDTPVLALSLLTSFVIAGDQWTGRALETGLFSYSIRAGWRYYGMGNEDAALLVAASIVAVGMVCDLAAKKPFARTFRMVLVPAVGLVVLLTAAAPFAGANAGVAVWGVIAFGVAWLRINDFRITWRSGLGILVAIVLLVGTFVALDAARGAAGTHLARFFGQVASGNLSAAWQLVYRKATNNYHFLLQTPYTWLALGLAAALAVVWWVPPRPLAITLLRHPGLRGALAGALVGAVFAMLTEDSGIVMPALMLFSAGLPALYLALGRESSSSAA